MSTGLHTAKLSVLATVLLLIASAVVATPSVAQTPDTALYVWIRDTFAFAGQEIHLPVMISNLRDTIAAYQIQYMVDRPNMMFFTDSLMPDTIIACANPPSCTVLDTVVDTVMKTMVDTKTTQTAPWEYVAGRNLGDPGLIRVTAIADLTGDHKPAGIPPGTTDAVLVRMIAFVFCPPDPLGGGQVQLIPTSSNNDFSDPHGNLILPLSTRRATITILDPVPGDLDYSGASDVLDVIKMCGCAFENQCPNCGAISADFNCDQVTDVFDVIYLIEYVFAGGPPPGC